MGRCLAIGLGICLTVVPLLLATACADESSDAVPASAEFEDEWGKLSDGFVPNEGVSASLDYVIETVDAEPSIETSDGHNGSDILYFIVMEHEKSIVWIPEVYAETMGAGWHMDYHGVVAAQRFLRRYPEDTRVPEVRQILKRVQIPGMPLEGATED